MYRCVTHTEGRYVPSGECMLASSKNIRNVWYPYLSGSRPDLLQ